MESINNIPEEKVFIQILKDHLHKQKTYIYENVNWNMICKYSKYHQVEAIVYYQTKIEDLRENYLATLYYSSNRKLLLKQLFPEITTVYAIVKGVEIANFYPVPQLRTMGDVDIVAHNREEFHNAFIKLGYEVNSKKRIGNGIIVN